MLNLSPPDLEEFVSNSGGHGFIIISFGTNVASILTQAEVDMLATAFGKLKQRVVWRLKGNCMIFNGNWTEWCTIQGVIGRRVISNLNLPGTITPELYKNYANFFLGKTSWICFISFANSGRLLYIALVFFRANKDLTSKFKCHPNTAERRLRRSQLYHLHVFVSDNTLLKRN